MPEQTPQIYGFDNFRLDVPNRQLLRDGESVPLPAKAFDMLVVLVENGGRLVGKDELFSRVWPDQIVEESNLTVQVSAIRKALGERKEKPHYITTVPGHGYRFTGNFISLDEEEEELVVEHHSMSRLALETASSAGADESILKNLPEPEVAHLTSRSEVEPTQRPRGIGWRTLLFAGLAMIAIPLGVILVLKLWRSSEKSASASPIRSIAVLPFKPLVASSRDESLELGMAETLITRLSSLREINVRPTTAVRKYNSLEQDAMAAGRELHVESVLDGSLQQVGDRLRVSVRLVRVSDGQTLWAERFDESFTDIFAVQDRVSEQVTRVLAVRFGDQEQSQLTKRYTQKPEAYQLYLRGRYFWAKMTADGFRKSIEYYNQAIKLDPAFALAYAGLADSYNFLGSFGEIPLRESHPKARAAATKALELDDQLAEAHTSLAAIIMDYYWDWPEADRHFKRALGLNPNYSTAHRLYSQYLSLMGRPDEAIAEAKRALDIDPLSLGENHNVGLAFYRARQYDETIKCARKTIEMDPNFMPAHILLGLAFLEQDRSEQAIAEFQTGRELSGNSTHLRAMLAYSYARAGHEREARKILDELIRFSADHYVSAFDLAGVHIGLGENDKAFIWLERSYQDRMWMLGYLKVEPLFDPLRSDPRFADLVQRVGLSPKQPGDESSSASSS
ncbi:MAG: winged helix-turn-helix domain-containing protein [Pyrinomonadaceae bacterium]|nr:winged helix-turn-helix domain-containing protein [Pyrinomonadaceae bacterium]